MNGSFCGFGGRGEFWQFHFLEPDGLVDMIFSTTSWKGGDWEFDECLLIFDAGHFINHVGRITGTISFAGGRYD